MTHLTPKPWQLRAMLDGTLSTLVMPLKPQPEPVGHNGGELREIVPSLLPSDGTLLDVRYVADNPRTARLPLPVGKPVWLREAWAESTAVRSRGRFGPPDIYYKADRRADFPSSSGHITSAQIINAHLDSLSWRSPVTMPRWASRLTLVASEARVCRVQDVTEEEARAAGVYPEFEIDAATFMRGSFDPEKASTNYLGFKHQWRRDLEERGKEDGPDSWSANPWVQIARVAVHHTNIDKLKEIAA